MSEADREVVMWLMAFVGSLCFTMGLFVGSTVKKLETEIRLRRKEDGRDG